jgi:hypothetical protein
MKGDVDPGFEEMADNAEGVSLDDFHAYMPMHNYIFTPSREPWPASSVNARLGRIPLFDANGKPRVGDKGEQKTIAASAWLDQNRPVEQMTWAPGLPMLIHDRLISEGGWIERNGCLPKSLSATVNRTRRRQQGRAVARSRPQGLSRRSRPHHQVVCPPGTTATGKDQPRPRVRR